MTVKILNMIKTIAVIYVITAIILLGLSFGLYKFNLSEWQIKAGIIITYIISSAVAPFGIGVVLGIFLVSKLVEYLLKKQERKTYFAIMGLVTSSPIAVLSGMNIVSIGFGQLLLGILLFIGGFFIANILGK